MSGEMPLGQNVNWPGFLRYRALEQQEMFTKGCDAYMAELETE